MGQGILLRPGRDVTLIANGLLVFEALVAAERLEGERISAAVVDMHTVKPLDEELILAQAKATGALVTAEEHQIWGGLGSAVARAVAERHLGPIEFVALQATYAESGRPEELFQKYGLTASHIAQAAKRAVERKGR
jgi:transketolase